MRGTWQGSGTWQTSGGGGGGLVLVVIAAALLLGSGAASAAVSALVTILIIAACVITAAALGVVALLVYRARHGGLRRPAGPPVLYEVSRDQPTFLEASQPRPAIEPAREIHLHLNVTPDQLAAILRHHIDPGRDGPHSPAGPG